MSREFDKMSAVEMGRRIQLGEISPVEVTRRSLDLALETQSTLNCFFSLFEHEAMASATRAEKAVLDGDALGPLHGIPFSVKDLIAVGGIAYASGSRAMAQNVAAADAPSVERMRRAGGIFIGKTTTSEFGCKPVGYSPLTGYTRNPWNMQKNPGGSSAGAAASVAAGITPVALGTDGGGSIRIPASLTGLFGMKAHFGRIPVWPTSATPTLAHVGPLTRNVADSALLLSVLAGHDTRDPFSVAAPVPDIGAAIRGGVSGLRIAYCPTLGYARPDPDVVEVTRAAARQFETMGCIVEELDSVFARDPADLWTAEFYAGVGTRLRAVVENDSDLHDPEVAAILQQALGQEMRDYYSTVFERYALREEMRLFFERYDLLLSPVLPVSSLDVEKSIPDHLVDRNLVSWAFFTYPFNLVGYPAASICAGFGNDGMPIGLQIVGRSFAEADIYAAASAFEATKPAGYNFCPMLATT